MLAHTAQTPIRFPPVKTPKHQVTGFKSAVSYCRSFPSTRQRAGEPAGQGSATTFANTCASDLSLCSSGLGYTSFMISTIIPVWLSQRGCAVSLLGLCGHQKQGEHLTGVSNPSTEHCLISGTAAADDMGLSWALSEKKRVTFGNKDAAFQINNTTDRSSILKRLEHAILWRETNRKMVWAGYSFLLSTKKHCSLFSVTSNVSTWTVLQGSLDGNSVISCMPASSQTALGQSKTIYPCFFHIM